MCIRRTPQNIVPSLDTCQNGNSAVLERNDSWHAGKASAHLPHGAAHGPEFGHLPKMVNNAVLELTHRLFLRLKCTGTIFLTYILRSGVVFEMAFTGRNQGKLIRIPALGSFGARSGRSQLTFGELRAGEIDNTMGFGAS